MIAVVALYCSAHVLLCSWFLSVCSRAVDGGTWLVSLLGVVVTCRADVVLDFFLRCYLARAGCSLGR